MKPKNIENLSDDEKLKYFEGLFSSEVEQKIKEIVAKFNISILDIITGKSEFKKRQQKLYTKFLEVFDYIKLLKDKISNLEIDNQEKDLLLEALNEGNSRLLKAYDEIKKELQKIKKELQETQNELKAKQNEALRLFGEKFKAEKIALDNYKKSPEFQQHILDFIKKNPVKLIMQLEKKDFNLLFAQIALKYKRLFAQEKLKFQAKIQEYEKYINTLKEQIKKSGQNPEELYIIDADYEVVEDKNIGLLDLKSDSKELGDLTSNVLIENEKLREENEKLREENEKLKKENEEMKKKFAKLQKEQVDIKGTQASGLNHLIKKAQEAYNLHQGNS